MFDIHLMDAFEKSIKEQMNNQFKKQEEDEVAIPPNSLMATYFMDNVFNMMEVPQDHIFTKTMEYRHSYMQTLAQESLELNLILEKIKSNYIALLDSKRSFIALIFQFLKWVTLYHSVQKLHYHAVIAKASVNCSISS